MWDQWEENHIVEEVNQIELHARGGVCIVTRSVQDRGAFDKQTETHVPWGALHEVLVQEELLAMLLPIG